MSTKSNGLKFSLEKIRTGDLRKKIASGQYTGDALAAMKKELAGREAKAKKTAKAAPPAAKKTPTAKKPTPPPSKKEEPKATKAAKKDKPKVQKKEKALTIRGYLRQIMPPTDGSKTVAVTFDEAKELVKKNLADQIKHRKDALYNSEYKSVLDELKEAGVVSEKKQSAYVRPDEATVKSKAGKNAPKKKAGKNLASEETVELEEGEHEPTEEELVKLQQGLSEELLEEEEEEEA